MIGRAVLGVPFVGVVFFAFTWIAKELPVLYASEPWQDDPYDAMVSFAMWCVPLLAGLCGLRVPLCVAIARCRSGASWTCCASAVC